MYDSLPKEAKVRVDATVKTLEPLTWSDRRRKITALVLKMNPAGSEEAADPETPDPCANPLWSAAGHYVAACIERLGSSIGDRGLVSASIIAPGREGSQLRLSLIRARLRSL